MSGNRIKKATLLSGGSSPGRLASMKATAAALSSGSWVRRDAKPSTGKPVGKFDQAANRRAPRRPIYLGPSVGGADEEYIKVVSGKVIDEKPSFA